MLIDDDRGPQHVGFEINCIQKCKIVPIAGIEFAGGGRGVRDEEVEWEPLRCSLPEVPTGEDPNDPQYGGPTMMGELQPILKERRKIVEPEYVEAMPY